MKTATGTTYNLFSELPDIMVQCYYLLARLKMWGKTTYSTYTVSRPTGTISNNCHRR